MNFLNLLATLLQKQASLTMSTPLAYIRSDTHCKLHILSRTAAPQPDCPQPVLAHGDILTEMWDFGHLVKRGGLSAGQIPSS